MSAPPTPGKRTSESRCRIKSHGTTGYMRQIEFSGGKNWAHICGRPTLFSSPFGRSRSGNCCQFPHLTAIKTHDVAIPVTVYMMPIKMKLYRCLFALLLQIYQSVNVLTYLLMSYLSVDIICMFRVSFPAALHNIKRKNKLSN